MGTGSRPHVAGHGHTRTPPPTLAFLTLYPLLRAGLRRLFCIDCLRHDSDEVRADYTAQLSHSFRFLAWFLLPCSLAGGHDAILGFS